MTSSAEREVHLARQMLTGDLVAFDAFVHIFQKRLFQYSFLMCGHREDAEEVAQETLLSMFQNLTTLREPDRIRSWVFHIAKNFCLMKRRKSIYAPVEEVSVDSPTAPDSDGALQPQIKDSSALPDEQLLQAELREALTAAIQNLPPDSRSVILLRDFEELSTEEAAHVLDISVDLVKQRLHRARLALRKQLAGRLARSTQIHTQGGPHG